MALIYSLSISYLTTLCLIKLGEIEQNENLLLVSGLKWILHFLPALISILFSPTHLTRIAKSKCIANVCKWKKKSAKCRRLQFVYFWSYAKSNWIYFETHFAPVFNTNFVNIQLLPENSIKKFVYSSAPLCHSIRTEMAIDFSWK